MLTASRSLDVTLLGRRSDGGARLILEFRERGLEAFAARYPIMAKDLVTVRVDPPDAEECWQLLESARSRLSKMTGIGISDSVLLEADRLARD